MSSYMRKLGIDESCKLKEGKRYIGIMTPYNNC